MGQLFLDPHRFDRIDPRLVEEAMRIVREHSERKGPRRPISVEIAPDAPEPRPESRLR